ncbi:uncharacterized protein V1518DRAFT_413682 [Limtongia smithiae]|uniref:uncharacterized protein n=1 Tax=Limtongia smithiae TaxID=1125753 RepID=UPI0034CD4D57
MSFAMASTTQESHSPSPAPARRSLKDILTPERKKLLRNFLAATTFAYISVMFTKRSILSRRYVPSLFSHNNTPPPFNRYQDAVQAVTLGTLLSCSVFGMGVTGTALVMDVHSAREFNERMKTVLGGHVKDAERALNVDEEVKKLEESIENFLSEGLAELQKDEKKEEGTK